MKPEIFFSMTYKSNGNTVDFDIPWGKDEPTGNVKDEVTCFNEARKGGWADARCYKKMSVVCQMD